MYLAVTYLARRQRARTRTRIRTRIRTQPQTGALRRASKIPTNANSASDSGDAVVFSMAGTAVGACRPTELRPRAAKRKKGSLPSGRCPLRAQHGRVRGGGGVRARVRLRRRSVCVCARACARARARVCVCACVHMRAVCLCGPVVRRCRCGRSRPLRRRCAARWPRR